jgi:DNA-binding transcriptional regulator YhcF (GntR family)
VTQPKFKEILSEILETIDEMNPGEKLPSVRDLIRTYSVSQATIERCLDDITRQGLIKRERGRGIFVQGYIPKSKLIAVCSNHTAIELANTLFLDGVRKIALDNSYDVADFGPTKATRIIDTINTAESMGFAGIILTLSTAEHLRIGGDFDLSQQIRNSTIPIVLNHSLPALMADNFTSDDFKAFFEVGKTLRGRIKGPVHFIGNQGLPSLARLYGINEGLGEDINFTAETIDQNHQTIYGTVEKYIKEKSDVTLIIGAPPQHRDDLKILLKAPWKAGSKKELVVLLDDERDISDKIHANYIIKPNLEMGRISAEMLIKRIQHPRKDMMHEIVPNKILMKTS